MPAWLAFPGFTLVRPPRRRCDAHHKKAFFRFAEAELRRPAGEQARARQTPVLADALFLQENQGRPQARIAALSAAIHIHATRFPEALIAALNLADLTTGAKSTRSYALGGASGLQWHGFSCLEWR